MKMEFKTFLKSYVFSAAVLFTGASASADEYVLTVVPVENDENQFQIECMNIDKRQIDAPSFVRNLCKKQVFSKTLPSGEVAVNLNTPKDHTSFSFSIGSFRFCYTFSSKGGVMKITGGNETDSLQVQNLVGNQTFEIDTVKANMLSIARGSWNTEIIRMHNCNANTVLLVDYDVCSVKIPLLQTSGKNYIHNLILSSAHIWNVSSAHIRNKEDDKEDDKKDDKKDDKEDDKEDGMMKVDGIFCNINGSIAGCLPSVIFPHRENHSQNALILRDEDLINDKSTPKEVDSTSKNCTFFSDTTSDLRDEHEDSTLNLRVKHEGSFYELPGKGCYRFILLGNFKCSGEKDFYCLLRKENFHPLAYSTGASSLVAHLPEVFGTFLRHFDAPAGEEGYRRDAFISLFKNVESVNLQIGKELDDVYFEPCELKCASTGHALVIIREDNLHQETHQETQEESSPFPKMK